MAEDPIPISALQHWSYCPRQWALIHIEQAFEDNVHTQRGHAVHERVDKPGYEASPGVRTERALPLLSERLGIAGKADVVEFHAGGVPYPIEYKHGRKRQAEHDDLQLAAQALCLEEMTGKKVEYGAIYHHSSRRRREVHITEALRREVELAIQAIRDLMRAGKLPPPVNDARCKECSLKEICQPEALSARDRLHGMRIRLYEPD